MHQSQVNYIQGTRAAEKTPIPVMWRPASTTPSKSPPDPDFDIIRYRGGGMRWRTLGILIHSRSQKDRVPPVRICACNVCGRECGTRSAPSQLTRLWVV